MKFLAAFDDVIGFRAYLQRTQSSGKVVMSEKFGNKARVFGGGLRVDSEAAEVYFERFQRSKWIFIAAIDLGFRLSDLRLLRRVSVDWDRGVAEITTRKTGKKAIVPLSDRCLDALRSSTRDAMASTVYVFATEDGKPYSESTMRRYFAIAKSIAGIERRVRLNDLRHTFASNLASQGASLLDIRDALGHTTLRMAERYARPDEQRVERTRTAINNASRTGASRGGDTTELA